MRNDHTCLPQLGNGIYLSDGGLETTLIFHQGIDLPHFAAFILLETEAGHEILRSYYERYCQIARDRGVGLILDTPTWRANPDWGEKLGYDADALARVNAGGVAFVRDLRERWREHITAPLVLNGVIGPRGDGYKAGRMSAEEAQDYHSPQIGTFSAAGAEMVTAYTLNTVEEAIGIARAACAQVIPCAISFTVETDGHLVGGEHLREAIEAVDEATGSVPAYFMVNCAHPTHFANVLAEGGAWLQRIRGLKANASMKSHAELDESATLDEGDPIDLGLRYRALKSRLPRLTVVGGCCGTDYRHVAAICDACT